MEQPTSADPQIAFPGIQEPKVVVFAFQLLVDLHGEQPADADAVWEALSRYAERVGCVDFYKKIPGIADDVRTCFQSSQEAAYQADHLVEVYKEPWTFLTPEDSEPQRLWFRFYPMCLHDTLALDLSIYLRKLTASSISELSAFRLDEGLLPDQLCPSLGQTILFFGEPNRPFSTVEEEHDVARNIARTLTGGRIDKPRAQGILFGSPVYAFDTPASDPNQRCHVLVWLATDGKTKEAESKGAYYEPLVRLLSHRAKMLFAFSQAEQCYTEAFRRQHEFETEIDRLGNLPAEEEKRLSHLEERLRMLPQEALAHAREARDIQVHYATLSTNLHNYRQELEQLADRAWSDDNLYFLSAFDEHEAAHLDAQIHHDLRYLAPSQALYDQMISTIRGLLEIDSQRRQLRLEEVEKKRRHDEATRDRKISRYVAYIAIALAVSAVSAQVLAQPIQRLLYPSGDSANILLLGGLLEVVFHLVLGGVVAWLLGPLVVGLIERSK